MPPWTRTGRTPIEPIVDRTRFKNGPTTKAVSSRGLKKYFQNALALFVEVATTVGVMDDADFLPNDLAACQRLLLAAFQQSVELEHQVADAKRQAAEAKQQATELSRVLDETAASYQELQQAHAATLDELAWYRRWTFGRRRERIAESEGQGHLFELDSPL